MHGKPGDFVENVVRESALRIPLEIAKSSIVSGLIKSGMDKIVSARYGLSDGEVK